jgi:hypothetical protein
MVEAATGTCPAKKTSSTLNTDRWFSYDKDGHPTTQWESTPHSGTYYKSTATWTGPVLTSMDLSNPSVYTLNYALDGEGRWNSLDKGSTNEVSRRPARTALSPPRHFAQSWH